MQSVAIVTTYSWQSVDKHKPTAAATAAHDTSVPTKSRRPIRFAYDATELEVELAPYPTLSVAEERYRMLKHERDALLARGAAIGTIHVAERLTQWAAAVQRGAATGDAAPRRSLRTAWPLSAWHGPSSC